jgi:hypothetical protein
MDGRWRGTARSGRAPLTWRFRSRKHRWEEKRRGSTRRRKVGASFCFVVRQRAWESGARQSRPAGICGGCWAWPEDKDKGPGPSGLRCFAQSQNGQMTWWATTTRWAREVAIARPMQRKTKEVVWARKKVLGPKSSKKYDGCRNTFWIEFKIRRFEYFQTPFELDSKIG